MAENAEHIISAHIIPDGTSAKFANMSIVCAALVVCMHIGSAFEIGTFGWCIREVTSCGLSRVAVPYFFLASGFFLAGKIVGENGHLVISNWLAEVRKRIKTLLVPLALWPIILMLWAAPFTMIANYLAGRPLLHAIPFMNGVYWPGVGTLWFIRFLFILVCLSPILHFLIKKTKRMWLILTFTMYWGIYTFINPIKATGPLGWSVYQFSLEGVAYFSTGMYIRQFASNRLTLSHSVSAWLLVAGMLGVAVSGTCNYMRIQVWDGVYLNLRHFPVPFLMAGMLGLMPTIRFPSMLLRAAFPVYLMHTLWAIPTGCLLHHIPFVGDCMIYLFQWVIAFMLSVVSAWLLHRFAPRVASVLFGGR